MPGFVDQFHAEAVEIIEKIDRDAINMVVEVLESCQERGGRLFLFGV